MKVLDETHSLFCATTNACSASMSSFDPLLRASQIVVTILCFIKSDLLRHHDRWMAQVPCSAASFRMAHVVELIQVRLTAAWMLASARAVLLSVPRSEQSGTVGRNAEG